MLDDWRHGGFGLYVHWPFCQAKCPYCDFNSHVSANIDQTRWLRAFECEIERTSRETEGRVLNSIFFGGGTPSLMAPETVDGILTAVRKSWPFANDLEVTLEANPTSVEAGRFAQYRNAGVNRISMGIQALNDIDLKRLGRLHSVREALEAFEIARSTFDRVSFDLIYARQDQTLRDWQSELDQALRYAVDHLSLYQLTIEPGTAFGARYDAGGLKGLPDDDLSADMYFATQDICVKHGFQTYEVSNHAKTGQQCLHNLIYWRGGDYVGIGPGAHGRLTFGEARYATQVVSAPGEWLNAVEKHGSGELPRETLTEVDRVTELVLMGLRLSEGLPLERLHRPGFEMVLSNAQELAQDGWVEITKDRLSVASKARPVLNAVLRELLRGY